MPKLGPVEYNFIVFNMSYQQTSINQFIPGYQVKSDFLPTRVVEGNASEINELVHHIS
jgi:hypothetical protein